MVVELDLDGVPQKEGSVSRFPPSGALGLDVRDLSPMHWTVVPVEFRSESDSIVDATAFAHDLVNADSTGVLGFTRTVLPIGDLVVQLREPYLTTAANASDLLGEITMLRHLEARRDDEHWHGSFGPGLSLGHAPCGNAPGVDPAYPYADGSIGVWGHDVCCRNLAFAAPQDASLVGRRSRQQAAP